MICMDFPPVARGVGYHVFNLSKKLIKRGHKVTVLTRGFWKGTRCENINGISVYRIQFLPLYPLHLQIHGFFINRLLKSIENTFDIVHFHNPLIPPICTSLPVVITQHGTVKGGIAHRKSLDLFSIVLKLFSRMYISIERKLVTTADKVIAVSHSCADELKLYYGIDTVEVVSNGVDTNFFVPAKNNNKRRRSYILYAGSLDSLKGLADLVMAAKYICQENKGVKFALVGKGSFEKRLKSLIHSLNLDENFSFAGYVDQNILLKHYQNATVFVHPSYHEGLPTTILEAMSCGIPTVATVAAGTSEIVTDGETGLLVPPRDPEKLAIAILTLLNDKELRRRMGENARKRVEKYFEWNAISEKYGKMYSNLKVDWK